MKNKILLFFAAAALIYGCSSCNKNEKPAEINLSPEAGTTYKSGADVTVKISLPSDIKADSIVYLLDSTRIASKKDTSIVTIKTDTLTLGPRTITAKVFTAGKSQEVSTNVVL